MDRLKLRDAPLKKKLKRWGISAYQKMSYALTVKKRKYYQLADAAANASDPSRPSQRNTPSGLPLANSEFSSSKRNRPSFTSSRIALHTASSESSMASSSITVGKPSYVPWDRKAFLERLESFQGLDTWRHFQVPEAINAALWAKRGWRGVGEMTVGCASCSAEVFILLPGPPPKTDEEGKVLSGLESADWEKAALKQLVERYGELIVTGHGQDCPWRKKGCDDTIQRLPLAHSKQALDALRNRYDSLVELAAKLPPQINAPEGLDMSRLSAQFSLLARNSMKTPIPIKGNDPQSPNALTSSINSSPAGRGRVPNLSSAAPSVEGQSSQDAYQTVNPKALILALFGWQAEKNHSAPKIEEGLVMCRACFLRKGLWLYREGEADHHGSTKAFEPTDHREFCPWTHASIQSARTESQASIAEPELSGWQMLLNVIDSAHASALRRGGDSINGSTDQFAPACASLGSGNGGAATNEASSAASVDGADDDAELQRKDKDMRARFKQLRRVFTAKRSKSVGKENVDAKKTKSGT